MDIKSAISYGVYDKDISDMVISNSVEFGPNGTFGAIHAAEDYLREHGFMWGSMQRGNPIGFARAKECEYISKWDNMNRDDKRTLDGIVVPNSSFRDGGATILFFEKKTAAAAI